MLDDEETFHHVCDVLFKAIDINSDGSLSHNEVRSFIERICNEMGLKMTGDTAFDEVFKELDADGDNDISLVELE